MTQRQQLSLAGIALFAIPLLIVLAVRLGGNDPGDDPVSAVKVAEAAEPVDTPVPDVLMPRPDLQNAPPDVAALMEEGRFWRASRLLRPRTGPGASPEAVMLRAKAEAGWGGWRNVHSLLDGKEWLDRVDGGDGWYLLGRAHEDAGRWNDAAEAYARFVRLRTDPAEPVRAVAELRYARALLGAGRTEEGVRAMTAAGNRTPAVAGWTATLAAEALAPGGDTARVRRLLDEAGELPDPSRARSAHLRAYQASGDVAGMRRVAERYLGEADDAAERAPLALAAGRALMEMGNEAAARARLRPVLDDAPETASAVEAARLLNQIGGLTPDDRLAIGIVYDRHGNRARAADGYRAWLASGAGDAARRREVRLRLVRALFGAGRYAEVDDVARPLFDAGPEAGAEAMLLAGRAQFRAGQGTAARATWRAAAARYPGSPHAAHGLFLIGDLAHDDGERRAARAAYRQAWETAPGAERAGLALMRLGGMELLAGDHAGAQALFDAYRERNSQGPYWAQATYWAGRARAARGDRAGAAALYALVREREPLSYYALQAAERLDEPYWPPQLADDPPDDPAALRRVAGWRYGLDLLREAGLEDEARAEVERRVEEAGDDRSLLYPWAETVNERGYTSQGIRVALALRRNGEPASARFLRILNPLPYAGIIRGEARANGVEPARVAALIRQESWFNHRARSGADARGLMQVLPGTGRGLASGLGIGSWDAELLYNPEINVALGTRFLAAQMRQYDGSLPSVYSAYNAGPGRVRQWRRFPEYRDEELFTERIPFQETRDYVKILTRNTALYRGLYGAELRGAR